jgi:Rhodopirellula transposase DDE domain
VKTHDFPDATVSRAYPYGIYDLGRNTGFVSVGTIVRLIAATTTAKGLKVTCRLDRRSYPLGREVTDEEMANINLVPDRFHGEWNYTIRPSNES